MPVWYETVREWVEAGELVLVGIIQEQHPDRCRLFAQWKELDFPILWDPFGLTGSKVVPGFVAIDEHGIVRSTRPKRETFEQDFLAVAFDAPPETRSVGSACAYESEHGARPGPHCAALTGGDLDDVVERFEDLAHGTPDDPVLAFRAGVARRLRYDSARHRPDDFQAAVEHWTRALALDPNQYIYRRRIQQYGPRMDKPYPFYTWVHEARAAIAARGETPIELVAELTPAELAEPRAADVARSAESPDPDGRIRRDEEELVSIETAVAFETNGKGVASVHVALRPNAQRDVHWNHEAGPAVRLWVDGDEPRLLEAPTRTDTATSSELVPFTFEVRLADGVDATSVTAYALYYVCEGESGTCLYLRRDVEVEVARP